MDQVSFLPSVLEAALKSALKAVVNKTVLRGYEAVFQGWLNWRSDIRRHCERLTWRLPLDQSILFPRGS